VYVYTYLFLCTYVCIHACILSFCMYGRDVRGACLLVCVFSCMYACIGMYVRAHACISDGESAGHGRPLHQVCVYACLLLFCIGMHAVYACGVYIGMLMACIQACMWRVYRCACGVYISMHVACI
jgi:hypothetical protein